MELHSRKINTVHLDYVNDLLTKVEGLFPRWIPKSNQSKSTYRLMGNWLVRESHLRKYAFGLFRRSKPVPFPGTPLARKKRYKSLLHLFYKTRLSMTVAAEAVGVRGNLRVFYGEGPNAVSIKVVLPQSRDIEQMATELRVRSRVSLLGNLHLPKIHDQHLSESLWCFCEEVIYGEHPVAADAELLVRDLLPGLWTMYESFGLEHLPVSGIFDRSRVNAFFSRRDVAERLSLQGGGDDLRKKVDHLVRSRALLPVSRCHGDLCPENLLKTKDDTLYVLDWEKSVTMPVVFDLHRLATMMPAVSDFVRSKIEGMNTGEQAGKILPYEEQRALAALHIAMTTPNRERLAEELGRFRTHLAACA